MVFTKEKSLEDYWRRLITEHLSGDSRFTVFESKSLSDLIISRDGYQPVSFFFEFKIYLPQNQGKRMCITEGFQQEILRRKSEYFEKYMRWIICNDIEDSNKYLLAENAVMRKSENLMGGRMGEKGEKTVNISPKIFSNEELLSESILLIRIIDFLKS
jgi:hypothetical protein